MTAFGGKSVDTPRLDIRLLGRFEVRRDGEPIPDSEWRRRGTKTLLKVLLTDPGRPFTHDQLIEALLPNERGDRAVDRLYRRISELRHALEPCLARGADSSFIIRDGEGYRFEAPGDCTIDTLSFERAVQRAFSSAVREDWARAVDAFEDASRAYRAEFLPEDRYEDWAEPKRCELRDLCLESLSELSDCYAHLGRSRQAILCCQRILALDPCRESVIRQLMRYEQAVGRRTKALQTYRDGVQALREILDVEPDASTRALYESVRRSREREDVLDPHRVAVIPFADIGPDSADAFLADGVTEALLCSLSKVAGLEVIARSTVSKYKGTDKTAGEIGREILVGSILEGSVQRIDSRARIVARLVDVGSESHLWAETYDLDLQDVLSPQATVARRVADALKIRLLTNEGNVLREGTTPDRDAYEAYVRGRLLLARRTGVCYREAIACFESALSIEPDDPSALAGLADAYALLVGVLPAAEGYEKARTHARRALELDPDCAEAHATLGYVAWAERGRVLEAEQSFLRAIELDPNCAQAYEWYAELLAEMERCREACIWSEKALALNPLSSHLTVVYATSLLVAGRLVEALDQFRKALEMDPANKWAWADTWGCLAGLWDWDGAEAFTRSLVEDFPDDPWAHLNHASCVMARGRLGEGLRIAHIALDLEPEPKRAFVLTKAGACYFFGRQYDRAIDLLRQSLDRAPRNPFAVMLFVKCLLMQERYREALEQLEDADRLCQGENRVWRRHMVGDRGAAYAGLGETEKAEEILESLMQENRAPESLPGDRCSPSRPRAGRGGDRLVGGGRDDAGDPRDRNGQEPSSGRSPVASSVPRPAQAGGAGGLPRSVTSREDLDRRRRGGLGRDTVEARRGAERAAAHRDSSRRTRPGG